MNSLTWMYKHYDGFNAQARWWAVWEGLAEDDLQADEWFMAERDGGDAAPVPLSSPIEAGNQDSREKLEADVRKWFADDYYDDYYGEDDMNGIVRGWLDRQAAITRREVLCSPDERDEQMAELQAKVDELRAELAKRDKGIARLKRQRDEARAELENARQEKQERPDGPIDGEPDSVPENEDCDREGGSERILLLLAALETSLDEREALRSQLDWWKSECARLERLNAELRDNMAEAIGHAADILALQDLSAVDMEGGVIA